MPKPIDPESPRFTLRDMAIAIAVIALLLAIFIQAPSGFLMVFLPMIMVACLFGWFALVPYRVRLPVETLMMVSMLALSAFLWQDRACLDDANRADEVAQLASNLADSTDSPREKAHFRRIAAKFVHKATVLRWKALRNGLIYGPYDFMKIGDHDDITHFGILEVRDRLEADRKAIADAEPVGPE